MCGRNYKEIYNEWKQKAAADSDLAAELQSLEANDKGIEDAFYRDLEFGTGGLRGIIGAGTNRMNIYTVAKASQGVADYVVRNFPKGSRRIAVSFDSRIKSELFARMAAGVFAANRIQVFMYEKLMPTPCLSYAVRYLHCAAGIMVTASHNPAKYNGYKVYGPDGCQITTKMAEEIYAEIQKLDIFEDIKVMEEEEAFSEGLLSYIGTDVVTAYIEEVKRQSVLGGEQINREVAIIYTPLNGTGLVPVTRVLKESGFTNVTLVKEQEMPDGNFPTCQYPNPEIREAMSLGMEYAKSCQADLLLATDPDCDRVGIAVKNSRGEYVLLSGNETGVLLLDYICARRVACGTMPENPVFCKTIVTSDMAERIAAHYGVRTINVLTGFKFIGEQIGYLEAEGKANSYVFGFEESYGYLSGSYVRDKDAVVASFLICEMFAYYKAQGISLLDKLDELYRAYGYCLNTLHSYEFEGADGQEKMQEIMRTLRGGMEAIGTKKVLECLDYAKGLDGLPKSDVLKYALEDGCSVVVRPSGTEPKLKVYFSICAADKDTAMELTNKLEKSLSVLFG